MSVSVRPWVAAFVVLGAVASGPGTASAASLVASPNPTWAGGAQYWVSGCGFAVDKAANIVIRQPEAIGFFPVAVDASGCIRFTAWTGQAGTYAIEAWQSLKRKRQSLMATTSLEVVD
jgi:hypothetical protein